jgi:hypothetical protein
VSRQPPRLAFRALREPSISAARDQGSGLTFRKGDDMPIHPIALGTARVDSRRGVRAPRHDQPSGRAEDAVKGSARVVHRGPSRRGLCVAPRRTASRVQVLCVLGRPPASRSGLCGGHRPRRVAFRARGLAFRRRRPIAVIGRTTNEVADLGRPASRAWVSCAEPRLGAMTSHPPGPRTRSTGRKERRAQRACP